MWNFLTGSLRAKLITMFAVSIAIAAAAVATASYLQAKEAQLGNLTNRMKVFAEEREQQLVAILTLREMQLHDFAGVLARNIESKRAISVDELREQAEAEKIAEFALLSTDGRVIVTTSKEWQNRAWANDPAFLRGSTKTYVGDFFKTATSTAYVMSVPLEHDGRSYGVLVAGVKAKLINDAFMRRGGLGESGEVYVVNSRGLMTTESRFDADAVLKRQMQGEVLEAAQSGKDKEGLWADYRGTPVYGAIRSAELRAVGGNDWTVVAEIDEAEALLPVIAMRNNAMMIAGAMSALAIVIAFFFGTRLSAPLVEATNTAASSASQILATVREQSASVSETASAVGETSATIGEIRQTSAMAAEKGKVVVDIAERSLSASNEALDAISQGMEAMRKIREEVEGIARNILELSEKNIQIGDIVQSVNAIAEQSNLLAVNASIEAAKAGEFGKGFAVVANEVKALAGQSKEATEKIRSILGEIQKSSNAAVMVTEQGTKRVEEGSNLIEELGETFKEIAKIIEESAGAARQISMTANQQMAGLEQIASSMRNIEQASKDNSAGMASLEQAADQITKLSRQLSEVVQGSAGHA